MTTRLARVSTKSQRKVVVQLLCPSCRGVVRAQHVGHAVIGGTRKEVVRCLSQSCGLVWVPERRSIPAAA
ncbi:hypothetical protein [Streptacidiphilus anmyonensis]|uniref:hypothetical protein n=1 Tax=Streptacidiphilus anmyonensis TaxID=405782 RepID=UPI0005A7CF9D|nr:hypothetical protein [Streptacidiphilus anmyonensis]